MIRHSKSEENIGDTASSSTFTSTFSGNICDFNDPDWSREDDEISREVV